MKPETKIALRRFALRWLRKLVDLADERLHAAEVRFREEMQISPVRESGDTTEAKKTKPEATVKLRAYRHHIRRRGISSSAFDLRFSSQRS